MPDTLSRERDVVAEWDAGRDVGVATAIEALRSSLAHLDALTAAAREFFGGGRWQYHDEYAHVLLVDLDRLHDALLPDEEPHDA
jgi:hypothetical protein